MRRPAMLACLLLLTAACGGGGTGDLNTVAAAIRTVEDKGADFSLTLTETETGADIPKGKFAEQIYTSAGVFRDDNAALVLGTKDPASGRTTSDFDIIVNDSNVFVRPHGVARDWFTTYTFAAEEFIPGVRLNLVRESVLLASRVSKSTSFSGGSFVNQYVVTPADEQLKQLMGFGSSGTITASIATDGGLLQSLAFYFSGVDSASQRHITVDSTLTISHLGKAAAPQIPTAAVNVQPADLFSTSTTTPSS
ncbi:MAG TPA: hypothetical protein VNG93_01060 [Candidatus Dormibacteraeota bacterium]|nr:hypothetical protein [Candidatus Dormibacteraeota bacterium]